MEEPIITRNPLKSLLQKMHRKQPCLKLPFTTPRAQARRDSFKVGLGTKNRIFPVHKYQSHHSVYGRNKSRGMYLGKTITTHTYLGAKSLSYEGVFHRKKVGQLYNFSAKFGWDKSQPFLYVPLGLSARQRAIHSNMRSYLASRDRVCDTVLNFHG